MELEAGYGIPGAKSVVGGALLWVLDEEGWSGVAKLLLPLLLKRAWETFWVAAGEALVMALER